MRVYTYAIVDVNCESAIFTNNFVVNTNDENVETSTNQDKQTVNLNY